ncbi:MAG: 4-alpha-glucanotransferase [Treponema sp.]|jgi:4-alpha-glucanotransferase|nr:4-alpha-glucanotransferase [Treponema sp.]
MQNIVEENTEPNPMYENPPRYAGILFHITSLPGPYGIGDLGSTARSFADFLAAAGVGLWQILPLGPIGYGSSPYAARSSFAGNELLISPDMLAADGLIKEAELAELRKTMAQTKADAGVNRVDYGLVEKHKLSLLRKAARRFAQAAGPDNSDFEAFCKREAYWLEDYAIFQLLCEDYYDARWHTVWDRAIAKREKEALDKLRKEKAAEIHDWKILQYFFERQWQELKTYVNGKGIRIIGDIPIFTAADSADTWSRIDLFKTDDDGNYTFVSGVPPDYFSSTGQLWGNPVYDWEKMKADGYSWWTDRIRHLLSQVDLFRIDHFRGFDAYWSVPAGNQTAEHGTWEDGPGADLFLALEKKLGKLPIIAEDLGLVTESVVKLRDDLGFPGMKVCQFGFEVTKDGVLNARHLFLPHNYSYPWAAYTGTHDNDTTAGWYTSLDRDDRRIVAAYFNCNEEAEPADIAWAMIRAIASSYAEYAIYPLQDLLGLGREARFNTPSTCNGENWSWRLWEIPGKELARRFSFMMSLFGRRN